MKYMKLFMGAQVLGPVKFWRIFIDRVAAGAPHIAMAEMQLRLTPGGANLSTTGAAFSASSSTLGYSPAAAFDGSISTMWRSAAGVVSDSWLAIGFPVPYEIKEVTLISGGIPSSPIDFKFQSSPDGVMWRTVAAFIDQPTPPGNSVRTFQI